MKKQLLFLLMACLAGLLCFQVQTLKAQNTLQAYGDTIDIYPFVPVVYDILANDQFPAGDTLHHVIVPMAADIRCTIGPNFQFTFLLSRWGNDPEASTRYMLVTNAGDTSGARIHYRIHDRSCSTLDINNVSALLWASGNHFFKEDAAFEVPKGSGKTSIFSNALWIGGKDAQQQLHFAGERYQQGPTVAAARTKPDFYAGPVMDSSQYSIYQDTVWNRIWNLKKSDIDYHRAHFWEPGYVPIEDILTWPGNGDVALGQAPKLAPFSDRNGDEIYDPFDGDYPEIRGDQALFFIFNDDRGPHLESEGAKLRIEIHGMAYAFDMPGDSALKNTVFLYYKIFNRSLNTYDSTLIGIFTDIDLGYASDDFLGCDVERNMHIGYNGTPVDGSGQPEAYGENPPAQSVTIIGGPFMDPDGEDNPRFDGFGNQLCDASINGLYFGDGIADNERLGMQRFLYFNNSASGVPQYMTDPNYADEYYAFLCGKWKDGTTVFYGGNGHPSAGGYGPECRFMFPGESDSLNWGTGCLPPNGPVNWTETTAGNNPGDRRGVMATGPFTFEPGDVQVMDLAFVWARDYDGDSPLSSVNKLQQLSEEISEAFAKNLLPNGDPFYGIRDTDPTDLLQVSIYPNPTTGVITIDFLVNGASARTTIDVLSSQSVLLKHTTVEAGVRSVSVDISDLPSGVCFVKLTTNEKQTVKKVIILK